MYIIDLNQTIISSLMAMLGSHAEKTDIEEDLLRHFVLNAIRGYRSKFNSKYGEMVITCDDKDYWRKAVYPYYKANRKKAKEESKLDWNMIFRSLNKIRDELKEYFPYRVIQIDTAEADDIIATLVMRYHKREKILIISGDKDFKQLQVYPNVEQYDPVRSKFLVEGDPVRFLKEHIIKGDSGDGICNIRSPESSLVLGIRQKPISSKMLDVWVDQEPEEFCDTDMLRRYKQNEAAIDLSKIPEHLQEAVLNEFEKPNEKDRSKLMGYFVQNRLKNLLEDIQSF